MYIVGCCICFNVLFSLLVFPGKGGGTVNFTGGQSFITTLSRIHLLNYFWNFLRISVWSSSVHVPTNYLNFVYQHWEWACRPLSYLLRSMGILKIRLQGIKLILSKNEVLFIIDKIQLQNTLRVSLPPPLSRTEITILNLFRNIWRKEPI